MALAKRPYGTKGIELSIIGFGGIVVMGADALQASERVAHAIERGVNYFDVAPSYGDAEARLGPALKPYRDGVFLACKTTKRTAADAQAELETSLKLLETDHLDLYQLHSLTTMEDVDTAFGKGGAMEVFEAAKSKGVVTHLGFSAHTQEAALAAMNRFDFDSILFPLNYAAMICGGFGPRVMAEAQAQGVSRLALKGMARGPWQDGAHRTHSKCWYQPLIEREEARLALRYTLSLPITAAIPPGELDLFNLALEIAEEFVPLSADEMPAVASLANRNTPLFASAS